MSASIENNKFAILFSGAPFLSVFLFSSLHEARLAPLILAALFIGACCLFLTMVYSMLRLVLLHRYKAIILSSIALGKKGDIQIAHPPRWMSSIPGIALLLGFSTIILSMPFIVLV
ncbi:hypothetical protein [uncultured Roseobacter sp.]|uniref:hypothetical protein n=1 Tax=uncultured Roseobacter sp. TaxID=114847 RepID=UPI00260E26C0|nr:hypothetical protein [uncultured Roseobacter sp.]